MKTMIRQLQVDMADGTKQRYCQQCSRFHTLDQFDDIKR